MKAEGEEGHLTGDVFLREAGEVGGKGGELEEGQ